MRVVPRLKCPACGSGNTRTMIGKASVKWIDGVAWRLHYCLVCDHRFPSVQRHPNEEDYIAADAGN